MTKKSKYFWVDIEKNQRLLGYKNKSSFYASKAWRELRDLKLTNNPFCEACEKQGKLLVVAIDVDHIEPIEKAPHLALDIDNLQSLCKACHYDKTGEENRNRNSNKQNKGSIINKKWLK